MSTQMDNIFQILPELPKPFITPSCISFKDEILICGGYETNCCYSYHTLKKQYKYICSYPNGVRFNAHCIVQLAHPQADSNEIHLLSFGGQDKNKIKQTFSMKYKSVWEISDNHCNSKSDHDSISQNVNNWTRFAENCSIGKLEDSLRGLCGLIGGKNNDLLFITCYPEDIEVINLKTMKPLTGIKNNIIPKGEHKLGIQYHCFVPLTIENEKVANHFILFCYNTGLLIKYDEQNKIFNYEKLPICPALSDFALYSKYERSKLVHKYSMKKKTWDKCKFTLPAEIYGSFAILSGNDTSVHIIGGEVQKMHMSINVHELFERSELLKMAEMYGKMIELKKEIAQIKLERPY
ncbi:hypothetical protein RFI_26340, partial [Reticulomyxa filosa]